MSITAKQAQYARSMLNSYAYHSCDIDKEALGILAIAISKQIPLAATHEASIYDVLTCPSCKNVISRREAWGESDILILPKYCPFCGQMIGDVYEERQS